jgi:hypothetical protein
MGKSISKNYLRKALKPERNNIMENMEQEVEQAKYELDKYEAVTNEVKIENDRDLNEVVVIGVEQKRIHKMITAKKESFTKPINEALRNIRDFFSPLERRCELMERELKVKIDTYMKAQQAEADRKIGLLEARVEKGTMKLSTAADKMAELEPTKKVEMEDGSGMGTRNTREMEITDESLIPREYLVIDHVRLRKAVLDGAVVPGTRVVNKVSVIFKK